MRVRFFSSFDAHFRRLQPLERRKVQTVVDHVIDYLTQSLPPPKGLGLKKLRDPFWEVRIESQLRIIFSLEEDLLQFVLVGNHDDIRRFLRR